MPARLYHTFLDCGHDNLLPKRWAVCSCSTCGREFINLLMTKG
jgi:hypothetical protein